MTSCARCNDPAQVAMAFDYAERRVWLDDLGPGFDRFVEIPLCELHAARLTPPMGWELMDGRQIEPPLFLAADVA
jgi:hypothetical protein